MSGTTPTPRDAPDAFAPQALPRRFLLCGPDHFDVAYQINPWMGASGVPDLERSWDEWHAFGASLREAGAQVFALEGQPGLPDMVFPADVAVADGNRFLRARFRAPERREEARHAAHWLASNGFTELDAEAGAASLYLEGGDVLAFRRGLVVGHGFRTDLRTAAHLATTFGVPVTTVGLRDARFYHLDMSFCPLDDRRAICAPDVWDEAGRQAIAALVPEPLIITPDEAATFCANSVTVGRVVVMPACPSRVRRQLEAWGFEAHVSPVNEFLKAGGGPRCMSLDLDLLAGDRAGAEVSRNN